MADDPNTALCHCNHYLHMPDTMARVLLIRQLSSHIAVQVDYSQQDNSPNFRSLHCVLLAKEWGRNC
eukprot:7736873-Ditylum_brightwellii.AAC.1